jgi:uncharacterized protein with LGFP repeats
MAAAYSAAGGESGALGYPVTGLICGMKQSGCGQVFQGGRIYSTPATGAHALTGVVHAAWVGQGYEVGPLGYPLTDLICGMKESGCGQVFQGGRIYRSASTGPHAVSGVIQDAWVATGWEVGTLGYPTGDQVCGLYVGGCKQEFQSGTLYSTWSTGTHPVSGAIATTWTATGGESGTLGYPTGDPVCGLKDGGCSQTFQHGSISTVTGAGTHALTGPIRDAWVAQGSERGSLGYPTSDPYAVTGGTAQDFQSGKLTVDSSDGNVSRS